MSTAMASVVHREKIAGYRSMWYNLASRGKVTEYGPKYSGGLGTYCAKHRPLAVYAAAANKTFFVYGGECPTDPTRRREQDDGLALGAGAAEAQPCISHRDGKATPTGSA